MVKVLLIEPDVLLAQTYARALECGGHEVFIVHGAQAAIDTADDSQPDVVLLELQLVSHSGIEFLYEFRSYTDWLEVPVVILSNVPPAEFQESADVLRAQLGIREYYYKPHMTLERLLKIVEAATVHT